MHSNAKMIKRPMQGSSDTNRGLDRTHNSNRSTEQHQVQFNVSRNAATSASMIISSIGGPPVPIPKIIKTEPQTPVPVVQRSNASSSFVLPPLIPLHKPKLTTPMPNRRASLSLARCESSKEATVRKLVVPATTKKNSSSAVKSHSTKIISTKSQDQKQWKSTQVSKDGNILIKQGHQSSTVTSTAVTPADPIPACSQNHPRCRLKAVLQAFNPRATKNELSAAADKVLEVFKSMVEKSEPSKPSKPSKPAKAVSTALSTVTKQPKKTNQRVSLELLRLMPSDGFNVVPPKRQKREPKQVKTFDISKYDEMQKMRQRRASSNGKLQDKQKQPERRDASSAGLVKPRHLSTVRSGQATSSTALVSSRHVSTVRSGQATSSTALVSAQHVTAIRSGQNTATPSFLSVINLTGILKSRDPLPVEHTPFIMPKYENIDE